MKKLLSREEYEKWVITLNKNRCAYCDIKKQIVLGESDHWIWVANLAPYWRYNTLLISKKHKEDFDELNIKEFIDLQKFYKIIINHLLSIDLKHTDGKSMKYFLFMIRSRKYQDPDKKGHHKSRHLHINLCPDGKGTKRFKIDQSAVNIDIKKISLPKNKK